MKVVRPGTFIFTGGAIIVTGWGMELDPGEEFPPPERQLRVIAQTAFAWLAEQPCMGERLGLVEPPPAAAAPGAALEAERAVHNVIARARQP